MHAARMLHDVEIDWGWPKLDPNARAIARRYEAKLRAERTAHTLESVEQVLEAAARALPGYLIRARAIDDERLYAWQVVEGEVYPGDDFDETGMFPHELTADDFRAAGVQRVLTPLAIPDAFREALPGDLAELVALAWANTTALPGFRTPAGSRRMHLVPLPIDLWAAIKLRAHAERRTMSFVVQRALAAAFELVL